jgi:hypothetical protein
MVHFPLWATASSATLILIAIFVSPTPAAAQMGMLISDWNPKVGSGASYQLASDTGNTELELSAVATEDSGGKTGYWIELTDIDTTNVEKDLMVALDSTHVHIARAIHQKPGADPMELPATAPDSVGPVLSEVGELLGREDVATPAGTYSCAHYRAKDGKWEAWFNKEITPFGLVKMTYASGAEMVVVRNLTGAKDHMWPAQNEEQNPSQNPEQNPDQKTSSPAGEGNAK